MKNEKILSFFDHFPEGIYLKSLATPMIHGYFDNREDLAAALAELNEDAYPTLYFLGHKLKDASKLPQNCFKKIPKGGGIKKDAVEKLNYLLIDIDPTHKKEKIDGKEVDKNLTPEENQAVLEDAKQVKEELANNGFTNVGLINSGNGCYIVLPVKKVPCDKIAVLKGFVDLVKNRVTLKCSAFDMQTISPEHIFKVPGTKSTKGIETVDNPYRYAEIVDDWDPKESCVAAIQEYINRFSISKLISYTSSSPVPFVNVAECIKLFEEKYPVYFGGNHDFFVRVVSGNIYKDMRIESPDFERELRNYIRKDSGVKEINFSGLNEVITYMADQAYMCAPALMESRAYFDTDCNVVYYDMCNKKDVIKVTAGGIDVISKPLGMFAQQLSDKEQVMFKPTDAKELIALLGKVTRCSPENLLILASTLCVYFLGRFAPVPILLITGMQGSSKSTLTRQIQNIVHPQTSGLLTLVEDKKNIAIALSNRALTCFDNATGVKAEISDLLCSAVTGGCYQTRELYTTADERIIPYRSNIVINGIDVISKRTDLMERCILLEMEPIKADERKTEKEVDELFNSLLPEIIGAIFDVIKRALSMEEPELHNLTRMADFETWATKFALALGFTVEEYQQALRTNIQKLVDAVSFGNPIVFAIVEIMRGQAVYVSAFQAFYAKCVDVLHEKATANEVSNFPKSASALSRSLGGLEQNLKSFGIAVNIRNIGPNKEITVINDGSVIPKTDGNNTVQNLVYDRQQIKIDDNV